MALSHDQDNGKANQFLVKDRGFIRAGEGCVTGREHNLERSTTRPGFYRLGLVKKQSLKSSNGQASLA